MELDWITVVVGAVCSLLGALGGGSIFFVKENKRSKQLENSQKIIEEWKELLQLSEKKIEEKEKKISEKDAIIAQKDDIIEHKNKKIGALYDERGKFMANRELELKKKDGEIFQKDLRIAELEWNECRVNGCDKREPPRDRNKCFSCSNDRCKEEV